MITLVHYPHLFSQARNVLSVPVGKNVAEMALLAEPCAGLHRYLYVSINGDEVLQENWARVYPKDETRVIMRSVPMGGGGGKNPLRTVLSLAVMAAGSVMTGGILGALGGGGSLFGGLTVGKLVTTGVNLVTRLAVNALAPPARVRSARSSESAALFIQGARNKVSAFGRVPRVLGKHRMVPPMGALPYTETVGAEQYLRLLFVWGYGPLTITDLKIGDTPLADFAGVEVETRQGYADDAPLTLFTNSVVQNDLQVTLKQADGYVTRSSEAAADELSVDITLPRGLFALLSSGGKAAASVQVEVQYSPAGANDWSAPATGYKTIAAQNVILAAKPTAVTVNGAAYEVRRLDRLALHPMAGTVSVYKGAECRIGLDGAAPLAPHVPENMIPLATVERRSGDSAVIPAGRIADERTSVLVGKAFQAAGSFAVGTHATADTLSVAGGGLQFAGFALSAQQTSALRKSISWRVAQGAYDVRLRRLTADATTDSVFDEVALTALRTVRYVTPIKMKGVAITALRIKATDQLNGVIDRFNGIVHSIVPDWNGSVWVAQATSNPAALFRHVLQGAANARPLADSRLDLTRLQAWHQACSATGREYNAVIDYDVSVREVLHAVAAAGRASPALMDGQWAVVEDKPQTVPVQHFTPRNSYGFQGEKSFDETPHALRVHFINREKGYQADERLVFDDGYDETTATKYETLELAGITDALQAWKDGRYHLATAKLRPETYSFYTDVEHLAATRGDLIRMMHDVPMFGLMSGRIKALGINGANVDTVQIDATVTMESGKTYALRVRKNDGGSLLATVQTAVGETTNLTFLTPVPLAQAPQAGDLFLFGEAGRESAELIIKAIEPHKDLAARITCVDAAPAVHTADMGAIPAHESYITVPSELRRPPAPVVLQVQTGSETLIRHADGSFTSRIVITLAPPDFVQPLRTQVFLRGSGESEFRAADVLMQNGNSLSIINIVDGESYEVRLAYMAESGMVSVPLLLPPVKVAGTADIPADVTNLHLNVLGGTAHLSWTAVADIDLSHYVLRYTPRFTGVGWSSAVDLVSKIPMDATAIAVPAATGTYLLKAVDVGGRESANAALTACNVASLVRYHHEQTLAESPSFAGVKTNLGISDGALQLVGVDTVEGWADVDAVTRVDIGDGGFVTEGVYNFAQGVDLGAVYTTRLTADMTVNGLDYNLTLDSVGSLDVLEDVDQQADPSAFGVVLEVAATNDNPAASPVYGVWKPFTVGDYTARAFIFRARFSSRATNITPALTVLSVIADMPERNETGQGVVAPPSGIAIGYQRIFSAIPAVTITPRDMQAGDYFQITAASVSGFTVRFFDGAGNGVMRTFDYIAKGFGGQTA